MQVHIYIPILNGAGKEDNLRVKSMRSKSYRSGLLQRLKNFHEAAEYLKAALEI